MTPFLVSGLITPEFTTTMPLLMPLQTVYLLLSSQIPYPSQARTLISKEIHIKPLQILLMTKLAAPHFQEVFSQALVTVLSNCLKEIMAACQMMRKIS